METRSDGFQKLVDRNLDRGSLDGTRAEDRINDQVKDLEKALDRLRADFDRFQRWEETRSQVQSVLREADDVNTIVRNRSFNAAVERDWVPQRGDLNRLAGIYDLARLK